MAYEVPPLPYDYDALEPHIDEATMRVHHDKHHQAYVDKVNAALEGTDLADAAIEDVLKDLSAVPDDKRTAVRNNGGGHYNHSLFWEWMSPDGGGAPDGDLGAAIDEAFGSFDDFKTKVKDAGVGQFGSGWAWLVHDGSGLAVVSTANQDSPVSDGKTPLLGVDVWEHAYYLKYQNKRPDYIDAWWNVVNWAKVAEGFSAVPEGGLKRRHRGSRAQNVGSILPRPRYTTVRAGTFTGRPRTDPLDARCSRPPRATSTAPRAAASGARAARPGPPPRRPGC